MTDTQAPPPELDEKRIEAFAEQLFGTYVAGMVNLMVDLGHRTGLFEALAEAPATSEQLAHRAGLNERYVREWLGAVATAGFVDYDPAPRSFTLPAEHAACLTGSGSMNLAPLSKVLTLLAKHLPDMTTVFREGGGIPYERFRPEFTDVMDGLSRGVFDEQLVDVIVPKTGLADRLADGIQVADIGCGTGHSTNVLARAFRNSRFVGYDLAEDALELARTEAAGYELTNVSFEALDLTSFAADPPMDAVFAFDVIHDQVDPATVLQRVRDALAPGGVFVMMDTKSQSDLVGNIGNPFAPLLYAVSTMHCMTVSLAHDGAGLGTAWGEQLARRMLADAGFGRIETFDVPDDPLDMVFVAATSS